MLFHAQNGVIYKQPIVPLRISTDTIAYLAIYAYNKPCLVSQLHYVLFMRIVYMKT